MKLSNGAALAGLLLTVGCGGGASGPPEPPARFGVGRPATAEEIAAWNIDVNGAGDGLPDGRGTVERGAALYVTGCARCHGADGEGGYASQLIHPTSGNVRVRRNVASHWPFAPPLFDYIRRTMPPEHPQSLPDDDVYALVAYLLEKNGVALPNRVADARSLSAVVMPSRDKFVPDDRRGGPEVR